MLYVSTRNAVDVFTAYRALHEAGTPDGGYFVPFRMPKFSYEEMACMKKSTPGEAIAKLLNLFFRLNLTGWDVECVIGRNPFQTFAMNRRLFVAEVWHNPEGSWDYMLKNLYGLMIGKKFQRTLPVGWQKIAIIIALLFGLYASMDDFPASGLDISVSADDMAETMAALYAKDLGLPFDRVICTFTANSAMWDFVNKGILHTASEEIPRYLECYIHRKFGREQVTCYQDAVSAKTGFLLEEEKMNLLRQELFAAVVSANRAESIRSSFASTNHYSITFDAAVSYGGLQDYRASSGISKDTLILVKKFTDSAKE